MRVYVNGIAVVYPGDVGSYCNAWDDNVFAEDCTTGQPGQGNQDVPNAYWRSWF